MSELLFAEYRKAVERQSRALLTVIQSVLQGDLDVQVEIPEGIEALSELAAGVEMMVADFREMLLKQERARAEMGTAERLHLVERTQEALNRTEELYSISRSLNAAGDKDELLQIMARPAREAGAFNAMMMYIDLDKAGEPEWLEKVAEWQMKGALAVPVGTRFYLPQFPFANRLLSDQHDLTLVADVTGDERMDVHIRDMMDKAGVRAFALVPLIHAGRWVGLLGFTWNEPHEFSEQEVAIYRALTTLGASAVAGHRLFEQAQARVRREQALREIIAHVRSFTDPDAVARATVREVGRVLGRSAFIRLGSAEELAHPPAGQTTPGGYAALQEGGE